jgi:hypothetical protein
MQLMSVLTGDTNLPADAPRLRTDDAIGAAKRLMRSRTENDLRK